MSTIETPLSQLKKAPIKIGKNEYHFNTDLSQESLDKIQSLINEKLNRVKDDLLKNQNLLQITLILKLCNEVVMHREQEVYTDSDDQKIDKLIQEAEKMINDFDNFCSTN